ncbi:serine/threonine protein phosphatase [Karstenula rhodostoma CBS 690.94]|uniref:Serine/threonine protein phosphatase n=1 Tax=Karstenula rhodostoma CBS 690.94 TaxID=1392251 RepID=A0A9P4UH95_9PLEO|nr:serine/threonine protein phosphatase [Karstenula rhodostoma CBS 690.94]
MLRDQHSRRPLIDLAHNSYDLDVSDEEDAFYAIDEGDYLLHPKWREMITRTSTRIPRRLQRYFAIYAFAAIVLLISWRLYIAPQYAAYRAELAGYESAAKLEVPSSATPAFKDMLQVKDLEAKYLPKGDGRLVVVGDVHGCKKELEALLKKVGFQEDKDHLVLTGDIISKGPDSPGVVSLANKLGASCVRGNHEDKVLLSIEEAAEYHDPTIPRPDVDSVDPVPYDVEDHNVAYKNPKLLKLAKSFTQPQIKYLQSCPVILRVGQIGSLHNVAIVHAGLVPDVSLEQQDPFQVMNMRTIDLNTLLPSETRAHTPWEKYWNHQQENKPEAERATVIYGHDRKRGKNIQKYSMGLDSGCVSGGKLTAMVIEEGGKHHFEHVKCKGYVG